MALDLGGCLVAGLDDVRIQRALREEADALELGGRALVGALAAYLWLPARADTDQADVTERDAMVDLVSAEAGLVSAETRPA